MEDEDTQYDTVRSASMNRRLNFLQELSYARMTLYVRSARAAGMIALALLRRQLTIKYRDGISARAMTGLRVCARTQVVNTSARDEGPFE